MPGCNEGSQRLTYRVLSIYSKSVALIDQARNVNTNDTANIHHIVRDRITGPLDEERSVEVGTKM